MNRRTFCALGGLTLAGLAGCLGTDTDQSSGDGGPSSDNDTDTPDDTGSGPPWDHTETVPEADGVHHLFIENHTGTTESAWVRVVRKDGTVLVNGKYELPDGRAIEFEDIAGWETTYTIAITLDGKSVSTLEWETEECGPDSESGDGGSRNAGVRLEATDDGEKSFSLRRDQCDAVVAGGLPAGPADHFRLDE